MIYENVSYLPKPNQVSFIESDQLAPNELTKTSFMIPFMTDGRVVMARNVRRGIEIPGGHVEFNETLTKAAHRECFEETGCWVSHIKPLGYFEMKSQGQVPDDWKYPHPLSYQQFFVGQVMYQESYHENDECLTPVVLSDISLLNDQQQLLINLGRKLMFGK